MASSRDVVSLLACALTGACSVGHGEGEISGTIEIEDCRAAGRYDLEPSAFFAQSVEDLLRIRVQRGSDLEVRSDGLAVLVEDAPRLKRNFLGVPLEVTPVGMPLEVMPDADPAVFVSVYLNETCPPGRELTPVALGAMSGTIEFEEIYAPQVDDSDVQIRAELDGVRFEDPRNPKRWAELSGYFDFLYSRGSPAQRFP